jgi:hypothetical protein
MVQNVLKWSLNERKWPNYSPRWSEMVRRWTHMTQNDPVAQNSPNGHKQALNGQKWCKMVCNLVPNGPKWSKTAILGLMGPFWTVLYHLGPIKNILDYFGPLWIISKLFRPYQAVLDHFGPFGKGLGLNVSCVPSTSTTGRHFTSWGSAEKKDTSHSLRFEVSLFARAHR